MPDALATTRDVFDGAAAPLATSDAAAAPAASRRLYWSVRGEVACVEHAPEPDSERWAEERWVQMAGMAKGRHGIKYQCQHCSTSGSPIAHRTLNWTRVVVTAAVDADRVTLPKTIWRLEGSSQGVVECYIDQTPSKSYAVTVVLGTETFLRETFPDKPGAEKRALFVRDGLLKNGPWTAAAVGGPK